tara:strand:+ start:381 stop:629 length:249 start_codon:yes stop_codon:yes gene_type:complete
MLKGCEKMNEGHFTYERNWEQIENMLDKAERKQNLHSVQMSDERNLTKKQRIYHMRQFKALEGVIKSLRWVLGDRDVEHPLE